jgi:hypothetical protein
MPTPILVPPPGFSFRHAVGSPTAALGGPTMPPLLLAVQLPPQWSERASTATGSRRCWRSYCSLWWSDRPQNSGWWSNHHPRRSDCPTHHDFFVACFIDLRRTPRSAHAFSDTPRSAHDSTRAMCGLGVHDSVRAFCGSSIPALLVSPSGYVRATSTASTSVVAVGEGRTSATSCQPSSNDLEGEAGLPAAGQQTHIVGNLVVAALSGAHLRPRRPHRPFLVPYHGGRI